MDRSEKHPLIVVIAIVLIAASSFLFNMIDDDLVWIPISIAFVISWLLYPSSRFVACLKILLPWAIVIFYLVYARGNIGIGIIVLGPIVLLILVLHTIVVATVQRSLKKSI